MILQRLSPSEELMELMAGASSDMSEEMIELSFL